MNRRAFLFASTAAYAALLAAPVRAASYGAIDAADLGVRGDASNDQSHALQKAIDHAASQRLPLFLRPGRYLAGNLTLPAHARLVGVAGATRLTYSGMPGQLLRSDGGTRIALEGLTLDGAHRPLSGQNAGLVQLASIDHLAINDCEVIDSAASGLALQGCSGHVERTMITGAADAGLFSLDATGLTLSRNTVSGCGNGGILVYRSASGADGTIITHNRITDIAANAGGSGQNGNGINVFRADGVMVSNNKIADCAFTAVRSNAGSNVQVTANSCLRSGETAIFVEFGFQGAIVASNLVDGAATGISISNFDQNGRLATCSANVVRNLKTDIPYDDPSQGTGIGIAVEADTSVTGNVIEKAPNFGLVLGWGPYLRNVVANNNVIREVGTGIGVSVAEGSRSTVISGNVIEAAKQGAIVGYRWRDVATGDLAVSPEDWPHLSVSGNKVS